MSSAAPELDMPFFLVRADQHAIDALAALFMRALQLHFETQPRSRAAELEAVRAIADVAVALVAGESAAAADLRGAFLDALERSLAMIGPAPSPADVVELPAFLPRH